MQYLRVPHCLQLYLSSLKEVLRTAFVRDTEKSFLRNSRCLNLFNPYPLATSHLRFTVGICLELPMTTSFSYKKRRQCPPDLHRFLACYLRKVLSLSDVLPWRRSRDETWLAFHLFRFKKWQSLKVRLFYLEIHNGHSLLTSFDSSSALCKTHIPKSFRVLLSSKNRYW